MANLLKDHHFHIVKRLFTPSGTGWNNGTDIGTEGFLCGLLIFQTTEEAYNVAKTSISLYEIKLSVGGEEVILTDYLTAPGREGRQSGQSGRSQSQEIDQASILDQFVYFDFARQPWDCRGKSVILSTNAGTADALRIYPVYLVKA